MAGTQMLSVVRGRVNKRSVSRTFHSTTAFADGKDAQTRNGLLGTGASDVQTAANKEKRRREGGGGGGAVYDERTRRKGCIEEIEAQSRFRHRSIQAAAEM